MEDPAWNQTSRVCVCSHQSKMPSALKADCPEGWRARSWFPAPSWRRGWCFQLEVCLELEPRTEERQWGDGSPGEGQTFPCHPAATCPALLVLVQGGSGVTMDCVLGPLHSQWLPNLSYGTPALLKCLQGRTLLLHHNHVQIVFSIEQILVCHKLHLPVLSCSSPAFYSGLPCLLSNRSGLLSPENINCGLCASVVAFFLSCIFCILAYVQTGFQSCLKNKFEFCQVLCCKKPPAASFLRWRDVSYLTLDVVLL